MIFFGKNLQFLRSKKGLTIKEIADNLEFTRSQWNNYESNLSYPKFLDLVKIAKYFDISENLLIHNDLSKNNQDIDISTSSPELDSYTIQLQKDYIEMQKREIDRLETKIKLANYEQPEKSLPVAAEPAIKSAKELPK